MNLLKSPCASHLSFSSGIGCISWFQDTHSPYEGTEELTGDTWLGDKSLHFIHNLWDFQWPWYLENTEALDSIVQWLKEGVGEESGNCGSQNSPLDISFAHHPLWHFDVVVAELLTWYVPLCALYAKKGRFFCPHKPICPLLSATVPVENTGVRWNLAVPCNVI